MTTIPQAAIDWLNKSNSAAAIEAFDEQYGAGQAARVLNEGSGSTPPVEQPAEAEEGKRSFFSRAVSDIAEGVFEAPATIAGGLVEGAVINPADYISRNIGDIQMSFERGIEFLSADEYNRRRDELGQKPFGLETVQEIGRDTVTGSFIGEASKFAGAFVAVGKVVKGGGMVINAGKSALASFGAYRGDEGRLTDMLLDMGVPDNMVTDFMKSNPEDSETMGRLKNVLEEGALGFAAVQLVELFKAAKVGDTKAYKAAVASLRKLQENAKRGVDEVGAALNNSKKIVAKEPEKTPEKAPEEPTEPRTEAPETKVETPQPKRGFAVSPAQELEIRNEARRVAEGGEPKADLGWRNRDLIEDADDIENEIVAMRTVMADEFGAANKPQSEQVWKMQAGRAAHRLAKLTGVDDDKVLESMSGFDNPATMAADLMARENFALTLVADLKAMSKALRAFNDTGDISLITELGYKNVDDLKLALVQRRELATNVTAQVQGQRSNIARAMRAMQIHRKGSDELLDVIRSEGVTRDADQIADAVLKSADENDPSILGRVAEVSGTAFDKINTYRINALLSGLGTQEVNALSNAVNAIVVPTEQLVGAAVTLNKAQAKHAVRTIKHTLFASREATEMSLKALYNDDGILDPFNSKFDVVETKGARSAVGKVVQLPSRFLMGMDEFFKQATYRGRLMADILDEADGRGLQGKSRDEYIDARLRGAYSETGAALDADALLQAQRITFTEKLTKGSFGSELQNLAIRNPFVRFIVPFVRTPMNILSQGIQKIPVVGVMSQRFRADIAAGGARRAQAVGKQVLGTALAAQALNLAFNGITREDGTRIEIVGSGAKDPRVRKVWLERNKPYSFKITRPDGSVRFQQYQRYEPLSYVIALSADLAEVVKQRNEISRLEVDELVAMVVSVFAENTVNKTFTQGISDFMKALTDTERTFDQFLESVAGSFVPNIIPQALDEKEKRDVRGAMDSVMNRIGMSSRLDRQRNALGEVKLNYGSKMDPMQAFTKDERSADPVVDEMLRLAQVHQSSFDLPRSRFGDVDLKDVPYSDEQSMFDKWMELSSEIKIGGQTMRERLTRFIESPRYKRLRDGDRDFTGRNEQEIKKIIRRYREKAKSKLMMSNDEFKDTIRTYEKNKRLVKRPKTLEQEINNGTR